MDYDARVKLARKIVEREAANWKDTPEIQLLRSGGLIRFAFKLTTSGESVVLYDPQPEVERLIESCEKGSEWLNDEAARFFCDLDASEAFHYLLGIAWRHFVDSFAELRESAATIKTCTYLEAFGDVKGRDARFDQMLDAFAERTRKRFGLAKNAGKRPKGLALTAFWIRTVVKAARAEGQTLLSEAEAARRLAPMLGKETTATAAKAALRAWYRKLGYKDWSEVLTKFDEDLADPKRDPEGIFKRRKRLDIERDIKHVDGEH